MSTRGGTVAGSSAAASDPSARTELLLALADDELCIGQNLAWWVAVGPFLEEDLALTSIAQDELGHARALFELLLEPLGAASVDALAYRRQPEQYRSAHLTELPCHSFAEVLVRHVLYDLAEQQRWAALAQSSWGELAALARRVQIEERIHTHHALSVASRLLATDVGAEQLVPVFVQLTPLADGLFDLAVEPEDGLVTVPLAEQRVHWRGAVDDLLRPVTLSWPAEPAAELGRRGVRSEHFAALHHEMVEVLEIDPDATW